MCKAAMYAVDAKHEKVRGTIVNRMENRVTWNIVLHKRFHFEASASDTGSEG
jgi:hypothetical protein